MYSKMEINKSK